MNQPVPIEQIVTADAVLRVLDPRLTAAERDAALMRACQEPEFSITMLAEALARLHRIAERYSGHGVGDRVDQMRREVFAANRPDDVLGVALNTDVPHPRFSAPAPTAPPEGVGKAEEKILAPEGSQAVSGNEPTPWTPDSWERAGVSFERVDGPPRTVADAANEAAMARRQGLDDMAMELDPRLRAVQERHDRETRQDPGLPPSIAAAEVPGRCNHPTPDGPCLLNPGHPEGQGWPGADGHIGGVQFSVPGQE